MRELFRTFARRTSTLMGTPWVFMLACAIVAVWGASGPYFHYSENWQLVINTSTTIITFLMVFLIQNTQNRDSNEVHLKLDELLRAAKTARNNLISLENMSDDELTELRAQFDRLSASRTKEHAKE